MRKVVVDTDVVIKWFVSEPHSEQARRFHSASGTTPCELPSLAGHNHAEGDDEKRREIIWAYPVDAGDDLPPTN